MMGWIDEEPSADERDRSRGDEWPWPQSEDDRDFPLFAAVLLAIAVVGFAVAGLLVGRG